MIINIYYRCANDNLQNNDDHYYRCVSHKVDHTMINKGELAVHGVPEWKLSQS